MATITRESSLRTVVTAAKSDTVNQAGDWTALILGSDGVVKVTTAGDSTVTLTLNKGLYPISVKRVWSTGTTVTDVWLGSYN